MRTLIFDGPPFHTLAFTRSARHVSTFITNAAFDSNIIGESIVPALRKAVELHPTIAAGLSKIEYVGDDPDEPSERIRFTFDAAPGLGRASERIAYFPRYGESGHMVTLSEPGKLRDDVQKFLSETGLASP